MDSKDTGRRVDGMALFLGWLGRYGLEHGFLITRGKGIM